MWEAWAALAFAAGGIWMGVTFRAGRLLNLRRLYYNQNLPFFVRNVPFAMIPYGTVFGMWFLLFALAEAEWNLAAAVVGYGSFLVAAIGFVFTLRPPRFMKPRWLLEREDADEERASG